MRSFSDLGITTKFILWFLLISLVPLTIAIYVSYDISRKILVEEVANSLRAIADNKANEIEAHLRKETRDVTALSDMSEVIEATEKFTAAFHKGGKASPEYGAAEQEFRSMFSYYQRSFGYDDIFLIDPEGNITFSAAGTKETKSLYEIALYKGSTLTSAFMQAKASQEVEVSGFEYDPKTGKAVAYIAASVFRGADHIGVLAVQMSIQGIYEFVRDYTGLGKTGETIVVSKIGKELVFITPLRFDPDAAFKRKIKMGTGEGFDIHNAFQGGISVDYRGRPVLSVWRYLPTFRLGMIVKMDTKEVFSSAVRLRTILLRISGVLLVVVVLVALLIARTISSPIKELTRVSRTISAGDLSARAGRIGAKDEIGELARSFNQMTGRLIEAKARVEEQKELLEEANKELDSFVYTVSHDLGAPLRGIDGFANLLEQDYSERLDTQAKDYLHRIRSGASQMKRLIDDLLTLSRISRIKNPYEEVDMKDLIRSVLSRVEFDIKAHRADVKAAGDLPVVRCDRIKMGEVFLNLISNAVKFSSKNKNGSPKVEIGYTNRGEAHEFYVKDNGIGIDKKYHKEIFRIFRRLHTQAEYEGTGAGLSIVKKVIDDHGGSIWVDSEPGKGAAFYFTIPKKLRERSDAGEGTGRA